MWIKNSPCSYCSKELLNYFRGYPKPSIYVGNIWRTGDMNDEIDLMRNGFSIKVELMYITKYMDIAIQPQPLLATTVY